MKTIRVKILSLLAVVILAASCSKEDDSYISNVANDPEPAVQKENTIQFSVTVTKLTTSLSKSTEEEDEDAEDVLPQTFDSGDYLYVYGDGVSGNLAMKEGGEGQSSATFEGTLTLADGATLADNTQLSATLKNSETGKTGEILSKGETMEAATLEEAYQKYSSRTATFDYGESHTVSLTEN
ncbi:MAG: hypothetical protein K6F33_01475, partial [Bacteroidales bacterium]|nr:hypothetical protein [Bacteroidales bacterium]